MSGMEEMRLIMPKLTIERMREIYLAGARLHKSGTFKTIEDTADMFTNHPEIKRLFEGEGREVEDCKGCGDTLNDDQSYCDHCDKPICDSCGLTDNETHTGTFCRDCCEPAEVSKEKEPEENAKAYEVKLIGSTCLDNSSDSTQIGEG